MAIEYVKVQGHLCPDCGADVLRQESVVMIDEHPEPIRRTAGYVCSRRCGWQAQGASLPV